MPRVRVLQLSQASRLGPSEVAVVVDVLRATTTMAVALAQGAASVVPVLTPEAARAVASTLPSVVLVGERARGPLEGFVDNSPATLAGMDLRGRNVVMTTTNGTRALLGCRRAQRVVAGGLVNAAALVRALAGREVAVVAAGWEGTPADDDTACAEYLAARLRGEAADPATLLARLEASTSAVRLRAGGKGADVDLCLREDAAPAVPVLTGTALAAWPGS